MIKVDKKVVDWVEKCVDKEYKRNSKKYDSISGGNGRIVASLKIGNRLNNYVCNADIKKVNEKKMWFMVSADSYASRISNWCHNDNLQRLISHRSNDSYYKDETWRRPKTDY